MEVNALLCDHAQVSGRLFTDEERHTPELGDGAEAAPEGLGGEIVRQLAFRVRPDR